MATSPDHPAGPPSQKSALRILHLEDDPQDGLLVQRTLKAGGVACETTFAKNKEEFEAALKKGGMDLVLSDFSLPDFDGMTALEMTRATAPALPFILVSGSLGEEQAVDSLKCGATDYVLKGRLSRLVPAVQRAMREVAEQAQRKHLEVQFIEAQKMEVIGQLAGGVAHDFNNIIAIIMGYSELAMDKVGPDSSVKSNLESIHHAAERAAGLTRQLLVFSRKQTVQAAVLDTRSVIAGMEKMLRRLIDENIEVKFILAPDTGRIVADPGHVGQVLMNLVINARDAMPHGGKLTVTTANRTIDLETAKSMPDVQAGDFVMLSVSDTGTGMSEEVKARIFEPFFTTKPEGKGTGLGLVTCRTIVQQSRGHLRVMSELGRGTTFEVYFPRVDLPLDATDEEAPSPPLSRGTETVLVVEDDHSVRQLARDVFEGHGYQVLTAPNGQEALRVARDHKGAPISIVVTDVVMPFMGGKEMAEWLKTSYPDLKILFTSGYTDDAIAHHGVLEEGVAFIAKPYTPTALARKVRAMLDNTKGGAA